MADKPTKRNEEVFCVNAGAITLEWPSGISPDEIDDVGIWLDMMKRKMRRSSAAPQKVNPDSPARLEKHVTAQSIGMIPAAKMRAMTQAQQGLDPSVEEHRVLGPHLTELRDKAVAEQAAGETEDWPE